MPQKILIITDDAGESYEILYAQHRFMEAGFTPVIAATEKKQLNGVIHDFYPGWNTYIEKPGYLINADLSFNEVKVDDYAAILLIGGRAPELLCHGIQILLAAGIGRDLKLTCYENVRFELESCGGTWINEECVRDGKIITGQTWGSHPDFYREIFAQLGSAE